MKSKDRVTVGWIDPGKVDADFCMSMITLLNARSERVAGATRVGGSLLSRQRNELVVAFLDNTASDWLFIIDSDETITPEAFDKLCAAAHDKDRPIVAGLYFGSWPGDGIYPTPVPMILRRNETGRFDAVDDIPDNTIIDIDAAGTGALLIHRSVLEAMRAKSAASPVAEHEAGRWCWFRDMPAGGDWIGEDIYFCMRAKDLGFPIVAATGARLGHHKSYWVTAEHHAHHLSTKGAST